MRRVQSPILLLVVATCVAPVQGATPPEEDGSAPRPRVALVLSGGGARGSAHVGVLEVMEELRIPVDLIVGTSMGAIVGGMYASGLSPDEMRDRLAEVDWEDALNDQPPRKDVSFRQKQDDNKPLFKLEMGFGSNGFSSPSGLVAGQKLNFILRSMLLPAAGIDRFDDLPIPFRAIAVDLDRGEMKVLDRGDLATAIRASMAFPVLFTPVEIDGQMYVDGGVLRNLPIDVALAAGADYVIAVDVSSPLKDFKEGPSAFAVLRRTSGVMSKSSLEEQRGLMRDQDLLITPELDGAVTFADFDKSGLAVERGVEAARRHENELRAYSVTEEEYEEFLRRQRRPAEVSGIVVESIEIIGVSRVSPKLVARRMQTKPGETLDLEVLKEDLQRLYQIGEFEQVGFELTGWGDHSRLVIHAQEKSWGPWYVRFGAALEANFKGRGRFTAVGMLRRPQINRLGGEWKSWLTFGSFMALDTEFYQPLEYSGTLFVAPHALLLKSQDEYRYEADERIPVEVDRKVGLFDFGLSFGALGEFRLGAYQGAVSSTDDTTQRTRIEEDLGGFRARFEIDQIDDANFPRHGTWALASAVSSREWMDATRDYDRLLFEVGHAAPFGRYTILGSARMGTDLGTGLPFYDDFVLGGLFNLSGFEIRDVQGSKLGFLRLMVYREVGEMPGMLGGDLYLGASLEYGNAWPAGESPAWDDGIPAGALFAGVDTVLGAFYAGYGLAEGGEQTFYILLGRPLVRR